jgi:hypothetical protein
MKRRTPRTPTPSTAPPPGLLPAKRLQELKDQIFPRTFTPSRSAIPPLNPDLPPQDDPYLDTRKQIYLENVEMGASHTRASRAAGVTPRVAAEWLLDKDFATKSNFAYNSGTDYLEDVAFLRAHENDSVLMRLLEARRPERYSRKGINLGPNVTVNVAPLLVESQGTIIDAEPVRQLPDSGSGEV